MERKYIRPALLIFLGAFVLVRPEAALTVFGKIWAVFIPVFIGILFAAVADPAVSKVQALLGRIPSKRLSEQGRRYIAILIFYLLIAGIFTGIVCYIIPQLTESVKLLAAGFDGYYNSFRRRYDILASRDPLGVLGQLDKIIEKISDQAPALIKETFSMTASFFGNLMDFIIGIVISIYLLASRDDILEFCKGLMQAALGEERYKKTAHVIGVVNNSFVNFIGGQIIEAAVLGTLCFAGMVIFGFEYPLLISTVIGVTALIPVAGAFIGAVPAALLLFLVRPSSALWFVVFIIVLQQLENNLIYPKIVGKSVGLPPVLILTAIIAGAELGGAVGIILVIPAFSAIYALIRESISSGVRPSPSDKAASPE
ncbi:MAG: AI-2E family transporter [Huintestinicola sp.]